VGISKSDIDLEFIESSAVNLRWLSDDTIEIIGLNGQSDLIILTPKLSLMGATNDSCTFTGKLEKNPLAEASVVGCQSSKETVVSIGSSNQVKTFIFSNGTTFEVNQNSMNHHQSWRFAHNNFFGREGTSNNFDYDYEEGMKTEFDYVESDGDSRIVWNGNWAFACDFHNRDLSNVRTTDEQCGPICQMTSNCTHFTWTSFDGGTCWMKMGLVDENDAFYTGNEGMVCGVVREDVDSTGPSGKYLDTNSAWPRYDVLAQPLHSTFLDPDLYEQRTITLNTAWLRPQGSNIRASRPKTQQPSFTKRLKVGGFGHIF